MRSWGLIKGFTFCAISKGKTLKGFKQGFKGNSVGYFFRVYAFMGHVVTNWICISKEKADVSWDKGSTGYDLMAVSSPLGWFSRCWISENFLRETPEYSLDADRSHSNWGEIALTQVPSITYPFLRDSFDDIKMRSHLKWQWEPRQRKGERGSTHFTNVDDNVSIYPLIWTFTWKKLLRSTH